MKLPLLLIVFFLLHCNTKFLYKEHSSFPPQEKSINGKIGLIGFYDFKSEARVTGKIRRYWTVLDQGKQFLGELGSIAKPISDYQIIDHIPLNEDTSSFLTIYTDKFGKKSRVELEKIFEFKNDSAVAFKFRNLDYYVLGNWSPTMAIHRRNQFLLGAPQFVTSVAYLISLGTIPAWQTYSVDAEFLVFDSQLKLIDKIKISDRTHLFISWWFEPNDRNADGIAQGENYESREIADSAKQKILDYTATKFKREYKAFK